MIKNKQNLFFLQGYAWNHAARVLEYVLIYFFSVFVARSLGPHGNGVYASIVSISQLLIAISSAGIDLALNRFLPQYTESNAHPKINYITQRLILIKIFILSALGALLTLGWADVQTLFHLDSPSEQFLFFIIAYGSLRSLQSAILSVWVSQLRTKPIFVINTIALSIQIIFIFILSTNGLILNEVLQVMLLCSTLSMIAHLIVVRRYIFYGGEKVNLRPIFIFSGWLWLNTLMEYFLGKQGDIAVLGIFGISKSEIGYYDIAHALAQIPAFAFGAGFAGITISMFAKLASEQKDKIKEFWIKLTSLVSQISIPLFCFSIIYAKEIIALLYSKEFIPAVSLFQLLLASRLVARIFGGGENAEALLSLRAEKSIFLLSLYGALLNIILNILLISKFGVLGVAIATSAVIILVNFGSWLLLYKRIRTPLQIINWLFTTIIGFLPTIVCKMIFISPTMNQLILIIIFCIIFWFFGIWMIRRLLFRNANIFNLTD
ncbi:MAG: oligosaccharide flippase family protein [Bacteroidota bacterium]|nr:oligosaccharide flippase family protein [Bacteroidota bacterium]